LLAALLLAGCGPASSDGAVGGSDGDEAAAVDVAMSVGAGPGGDAAVPARDLRMMGSPDLSGCKTMCGGAECGMIPNGCGAAIDCGDCGMPGEVCITMMNPLFRNAVRNAIELVKMQHPNYFDFND